MDIRLSRRRLMQWFGAAPSAAAVSARATAPPPPTPRAPLRVLFTRVMGERYYEAEDSFASLTAGDPVTLRREPDNAYDRRAIEVFDEDGRKLGYVARIDNPAVARMMDAGGRFAARIARLEAPCDIRLEVDWLRG